jgi:hypothetical protein
MNPLAQIIFKGPDAGKPNFIVNPLPLDSVPEV